jgi:DNA-binding Lrp family transcriptional regulator
VRIPAVIPVRPGGAAAAIASASAPKRSWLTVSPAHLAEAGEALASHSETSFAVATTGTTNLTAMVNCRDGRDLYRYLTDRVAGLRGVQTLESAPVIRTVKRAGTPLRRPAARP